MASKIDSSLIQDGIDANGKKEGEENQQVYSQAKIEDYGEKQITTNDQWDIINSFFAQNGVVNQQIQSFNRFVSNMIQDCVNEHQNNIIRVDCQFVPGVNDLENDNICYQVCFGQVYTSSNPMMKDKHGEKYPYFPHEARVRNLTYRIESFVDVHIEKKKRVGNQPGKFIEKYPTKQIELCEIPVMVRSCQCYLADCND